MKRKRNTVEQWNKKSTDEPIPSKLDTLLNWFKTNGITCDETSISIHFDKVLNSFSVFAVKELDVEQSVCSIPKSVILSPKNSVLCDIIEEEGLQGGLATTLCLMHEILIGKKSKWYGYIQALSDFESLPIFWNENELNYLDGTELKRVSIENELELMRDDYDNVIMPIINKYDQVFNRDKVTFDLFKRVSSLVASRAFTIDNYHDLAMVPLSDLFNHKSGAENIHMVCQANVCDICGSESSCEHAMSNDEEEQKASVSQGYIEMVISNSMNAGNEIFNIYEDLGNAKLLHKYGFCHLDNPFDTVTISPDEVFSLFNNEQHIRWDFWIANRQLFMQPAEESDGDNESTDGESEESQETETQQEPFVFDYEGNCCEDLLGLLHTIHVDEDRFQMWKKDKEEMVQYFHTVTINEIIQQTLSQIAEKRLEKYNSSLGDDEQELLSYSSPDLKRKWALILRICEKRILYCVISQSGTKSENK